MFLNLWKIQFKKKWTSISRDKMLFLPNGESKNLILDCLEGISKVHCDNFLKKIMDLCNQFGLNNKLFLCFSEQPCENFRIFLKFLVTFLTYFSGLKGNLGCQKILYIVSEGKSMSFDDGFLCQKCFAVVVWMRTVS